MADVKFSQFNVGGDCQVGDIVVGLRTAENFQFTFPGTGFNDANGIHSLVIHPLAQDL